MQYRSIWRIKVNLSKRSETTYIVTYLFCVAPFLMCPKIMVCPNLTATTILPRNLHGEILALDAYTGDNHGLGPIWATGNLEFLGGFGVKVWTNTWQAWQISQVVAVMFLCANPTPKGFQWVETTTYSQDGLCWISKGWWVIMVFLCFCNVFSRLT